MQKREMKPRTTRLMLFHSVLILLLILPGACTVFKLRHRQWEKKITRDAEGVAEFSKAFEMGEGRAALLLVHGFGDGPHVWEKLAPALEAEGFTVRALRLPGWGESPEAKQDITRADWLLHIQSELAELRTAHAPIIVLAHSMGGCLTTLLAVKEELDADGLILYAPMFEVSNARSPLLPTRTWFKIGDKILPKNMLVESLFPDHARVHPPRPRTRRDPYVPAHIFAELYAGMDELAEAPARASVPVRLVLPGEDRVIDTAYALDWFKRLEAPSKTLHIEEPAGHVLPLDLDFTREAQRVRVWIEEMGIR